ncbi:alpha/beta hydrolase [Mycoplasmoides gallisepticum]|uniref:Esterase n=1 Tax=Mycoplasmoides gallisepticum S6 TaxID=1006581 RepID=A0A0F6CK96_MYCGL|nr:alpha/beta hydrolase [Mycoplasmoides gallisepticum]ADC31553.1 putative esterase/lipase [Mycoplasmoides gallisepticum str. F]AHB99518.1 esterase [Mycoplasmoides gallisepticum S6]QEX47157.1 alpha/beta hydrolase [Mycoplasmoides gallisepticum]ULH62474.1 alpha/beta hydrolase [Mycoplasmoides gallisepticum]ULH67809.1 alpha/beta hydrolase [Mycoplasmoides gallisepticum]
MRDNTMPNQIDLSKIESIELIRPNAKHKLVFLHGFGSNFKIKRRLWEYYDNCSFYALNLPGHGESKIQDPNQLSIAHFAQIIKAYFEKHDLKDVILLGHSMGGGLAAIMNSLIPERIKLSVLEAPANGSILSNLSNISKLVPNNPEEMKQLYYVLYYDPVKEFQGKIDEMAAAEYNQDKDYMEMLKPLLSIGVLEEMSELSNIGYRSVTKPMLVIFGREDKIVIPTDSVEHIKQLNPKIEFAFIENSGHLPYYEHPKEFYKIMSNFIKSVDPTFEK